MVLLRETKPFHGLFLNMLRSIDIPARDTLTFSNIVLANRDSCCQLPGLISVGNLDESSQDVRLPGFEQWVMEFLDVPLEEEDLSLETGRVSLQLDETAFKMLVGHAQGCLGRALDARS